MEDVLARAGLPRPQQVAKYSDVARLWVLYGELTRHDAWRDYIARVTKMRDDITNELLAGSIDKYGNSRDNEKRAVLMYINRMLAFVPNLNKQYDELHKRKEQQEQRAKRREDMHGTDIPSMTAR